VAEGKFVSYLRVSTARARWSSSSRSSACVIFKLLDRRLRNAALFYPPSAQNAQNQFDLLSTEGSNHASERLLWSGLVIST